MTPLKKGHRGQNHRASDPHVRARPASVRVDASSNTYYSGAVSHCLDRRTLFSGESIMQITKAMLDSPKPVESTPKRFTGRVLIQNLVQGGVEGDVRVIRVSFNPGARTHWHHHPEGHILVVESGAVRTSWPGRCSTVSNRTSESSIPAMSSWQRQASGTGTAPRPTRP